MKYLFVFIGLLLMSMAYGQEIETTDFLTEIRNYDISDLLTLKEINNEFEGDTIRIERSEPLGYISDNYQRFYIHFISVIQNPSNKLEYFVYGKTRVKNNICSFQGVINLSEAKIYVKSYTNTKQGFVKGKYQFNEDPDQKGAGVLKGAFKTYFYIDNLGNMRYDALDFVADGYENNQFEGTWTSYNSQNSKKCNWGDYRIPDSVDLDNGAGEFGPSEKYKDFGWESYQLAWGYSSDKPDVMKARQKENEKWWIEKE